MNSEVAKPKVEDSGVVYCVCSTDLSLPYSRLEASTTLAVAWIPCCSMLRTLLSHSFTSAVRSRIPIMCRGRPSCAISITRRFPSDMIYKTKILSWKDRLRASKHPFFGTRKRLTSQAGHTHIATRYSTSHIRRTCSILLSRFRPELSIELRSNGSLPPRTLRACWITFVVPRR